MTEMAPNISDTKPNIDKATSYDGNSILLLSAKEIENEKNKSIQNGFRIEKRKGFFEQDLKWVNVISITLFHIIVVYIILTYPYLRQKRTFVYSCLVGHLAGFGVTAGAHRLWTHRTYKATWQLRVFLLFCFYISGQKSVFDWVRDHRVHHKYSETKADPHDSKRGFFFSHVGWLMMNKNPEVIRRGRQIDMSDILADPVVKFGDKNFILLKTLSCFAIPIVIPVYFWNEEWYYAITSQLVRYALTLNYTWSVNSAAHIWGSKPYDKTISPTENKLVAYLALGEGWHNYHHVFPWDYKAAELGDYKLNLTTAFIDFFSKIGWAYDLKQPSQELIRAVVEKRGSGSHITEVPEPESL